MCHCSTYQNTATQQCTHKSEIVDQRAHVEAAHAERLRKPHRSDCILAVCTTILLTRPSYDVWTLYASARERVCTSHRISLVDDTWSACVRVLVLYVSAHIHGSKRSWNCAYTHIFVTRYKAAQHDRMPVYTMYAAYYSKYTPIFTLCMIWHRAKFTTHTFTSKNMPMLAVHSSLQFIRYW